MKVNVIPLAHEPDKEDRPADLIGRMFAKIDGLAAIFRNYPS